MSGNKTRRYLRRRLRYPCGLRWSAHLLLVSYLRFEASFVGLVVLAGEFYPIPFRTRPSKPPAPMVLRLKPRESRSLPVLPRTLQRRPRHTMNTEKPHARNRVGLFVCAFRFSFSVFSFCRAQGRAMAAIVSSKQIEAVLREHLLDEGYSLSAERGYGETGTDIVATRGEECIHIEAIAFKSSPPARAKDFYEVFFRAVSRLEVGASQCVIALPSRFELGLPQRSTAIGAAWPRIGRAFPELKIWLVDIEGKSVTRAEWNTWVSPPLKDSPNIATEEGCKP
jgi:hypothetical protein